MPVSPESGATWYSAEYQPEIDENKETNSNKSFQQPEFFLRELEDYINCPRRYFYRTNLKKEKDSGAIYLEFHRAIHKSLNFLIDETTAKNACSLEDLQKLFLGNRTFSTHPYAELYTKEGFEILTKAFEKMSVHDGIDLRKKVFHFDLPNARVLFAPDFFSEFENENGEKQISARYWRNGKLRKKESDELIYQLFHESAKQNGIEPEINVASLKTGEEIFAPRKLRRGKEIPHEEKFASLIEAVDGISNKNYPPNISDTCADCRFYFICSPVPLF